MTRAAKTVWILAGLIGLGLLPRLFSVLSPYGYNHDWDWAVFGCQTLDMLDGRFRAFRYGQNYLGTLPLVADMISFSLLGAGREAQFAATLGYWMLFQVSLYFLIARIFSRRAALLAVLCSVLSPRISFVVSCEPSRAYQDLMLGANLLFLCLLEVLSPQGRREIPAWAGLGLLGGVCVWSTFLSAFYLIPAALTLALFDPRFFRRRGFGLAVGCFFIGSLPLWAHNLSGPQWFSTFDMVGGNFVKTSYAANAAEFFVRLARVLGLKTAPPAWAAASALIGLMLAAAAAFHIRGLFARADEEDARDPARRAGRVLLALIFVSALVLYASSGKYSGKGHTSRYLMLVYPFFHAALGRLWDAVLERRRALGAGLIACYALFYLHSQWLDNPRIVERGKYAAAFAAYREAAAKIFDFAQARGARYVAAGYRDVFGVILSFDAAAQGRDVVLAEPVDPYRPEKSLEMDCQPGYLRLVRGGAFPGQARAMGFSFESFEAGMFTLLHGFRSASGRTGAVLGAGDAAVFAGQEGAAAPEVMDRNVDTALVLGPERALVFEMAPGKKAGRLALCGKPGAGRPGPEELLIEGAQEKGQWKELRRFFVYDGVFAGGQRIFERPGSRYAEADVEEFPPFRFYRIRALLPEEGCEIAELFVFGRSAEPGRAPGAEADAAAVAGFLGGEKAQAVYADVLLSARLMKYFPELNCFNDYRIESRGPGPKREIDASVRNAFVVDAGWEAQTRAALALNRLDWKERKFGTKTAFVTKPSPAPAALFWMGFAPLGRYGQAESYAVVPRARSLAQSGERAPAEALLGQALRLWPGNFIALGELEKLSPGAGAAALAALSPEVRSEVEFERLLDVRGYTVERGKGREVRISVFADAKKDAGASLRIVLMGLGADERVEFIAEIEPEKAAGFDGTFPPGERLVFRRSFEEADPGCELWVGVYDGRRERVKTAADGKSRARLAAAGSW